MNARALIQRMSSLTAGGLITDENRLNEPYLHSLCNTFRAWVTSEQWRKEKKINPNIYLTERITFNEYDQEDENLCAHTFTTPPILQIAPHLSGIDYIGSPEHNASFRLTLTRGAYANKQQHRVMKASSRKVDMLYDAGKRILETPDLSIKHIDVNAAWVDPFSITTFNQDYDNYPLADDLVDLMFEMIVKGTFKTIIQLPPNNISDSRDKLA